MKTTMLVATLLATTLTLATPKHSPAQPPQPPQFASVEVNAERKLTFRILAPKATAVRLDAGDIPAGSPEAFALTKKENDLWEVTLGPVPAGAYRYRFLIDGVPTLDPRNPAISESNANAWSLAVVPGSDMMDVKNIPHGAVAAVTYPSTALGRPRRMHVYTPPGYEKSTQSYPVFYLLHGAGDCDDSWTSVGRANFILDSLIATGKAVPMIVVMPAGHTGPMTGGFNANAFTDDFNKDLRPYIERTYRVKTDRASRAIAGLSMGGFQTLAVAIPNLKDYGYIGVYSSGLFGIVPFGRPNQPAPPPFTYEGDNLALLDDPALKKGLKLFWMGIGKDDFLLATHNATVGLFKKHGFDIVDHQTDGGHTWLNWRDYLIEFTPRLFH